MNLLLFNLRVDRGDTALGFTTDWINALADHFDHITVITMFAGEVAVRQNVTVYSVGRELGLSRMRRVGRFYSLLWRALRERKFGVCFAHMMPLFAALSAPVLKAKGVPLALWYAHNTRTKTLRAADWLVDRAYTSTRTAYPLTSRKIEVLSQGIDTQRFGVQDSGTLRSNFDLLTVGRISRVKRLDCILRAAAEYFAARPGNARLKIVGEAAGPADAVYRQEMQVLARELGIADRVDWIDKVPFSDIHRVYTQGQVFVHANDNGLDKALLEAMSCALPVISCHPAVREHLAEHFVQDDLGYAPALIRIHDMGLAKRIELGHSNRLFVAREHGLLRFAEVLSGKLKSLASKRP
jgi:glycosyltransferase involved in cell wall biosynthesis